MSSTKPATIKATGSAPSNKILPAGDSDEKGRIVQGILDKLSRVGEASEGKWVALCPAHADKNPSLSISLGDGPNPLLHCFAGCRSGDVLMAIGMKSSDLFTVRVEAEEPASGITLAEYAAAKRLDSARLVQRFGLTDTKLGDKPAIGIPSLSIDGTSLGGIHRWRVGLTGKRFHQEKDSALSLYNLPAIIEGRLQGRLFIVEGESDVHALDAHGVPAVGVPGARAWDEQWAPLFDGISNIYAVVEPDKGGSTFRTTLKSSALRHRLRFVSLDPYKDAGELHLAVPDRVVFIKALEDSVRDSEPAVWVAPTAAEFMASAERMEAALFAGLPAYGIAVFSGQPRSYKSMAALQMAFATAVGGTFLERDCQRPGEVLYIIEDEDQRSDLTERMEKFEQAYPDAKGRVRISYHRGVVMTSTESIRMIRDTLDSMTNPVLVVFDTWARVHEGNENDADVTRLNLKPIHDITHDYALLSLVVHHDNRYGSGRAGERLRGSSAFYGATNAVWQFVVESEDGIAQRHGRVTIEPKNGQAERLAYKWDINTFLVTVGDVVSTTPQALRDAAEKLDPRRLGLTSDELRKSFPGVRDTAWKERIKDAIRAGALGATGKGRATRYTCAEPEPDTNPATLAADF